MREGSNLLGFRRKKEIFMNLKKIQELIKSGSDSKRVRSFSEEALQYLKEAEAELEKLAETEQGSGNQESAFTKLVNYRIAHLLLRKPNLSKKALLDIDERLKMACNVKELGIWPRLYRIAVLSRLKV